MKFLFSILFFMPVCLRAQTIITGKITHAFNANAEGKADAGSKIFVFKYEGDAMVIYQTINNFLTAKNLRSINSNVPRLVTVYKDSATVVKNQRKYEEKYNYFQAVIAKIKADEAERFAQLQALNAETNLKFDKLDEQTAKALSQAKLKAMDARTTVDEEGNFNMKVNSGQYIVLLVSNNRVGLSSTELGGKIFVELVDVKEGRNANVVKKFYPD